MRSLRKVLSLLVFLKGEFFVHLFLVYVNDMSRLPEVQLSVFADDTAVTATARNADYAVTHLQWQLEAYV